MCASPSLKPWNSWTPCAPRQTDSCHRARCCLKTRTWWGLARQAKASNQTLAARGGCAPAALRRRRRVAASWQACQVVGDTATRRPRPWSVASAASERCGHRAGWPRPSSTTARRPPTAQMSAADAEGTGARTDTTCATTLDLQILPMKSTRNEPIILQSLRVGTCIIVLDNDSNTQHR